MKPGKRNANWKKKWNLERGKKPGERNQTLRKELNLEKEM